MVLLYHGRKFMQVYVIIKEIMKKVMAIYRKYQDVIPYLFFGVLTTIVNVVSYSIFAHTLGLNTTIATILAWFLAVLFAYLTNRKWVFHSSAKGFSEVFREILAFVGCRVATGVVDWGMMVVLVDMWHFNDIVIKILANVVVIISNYVTSRLLVFAKKDKKKSSRKGKK